MIRSLPCKHRAQVWTPEPLYIQGMAEAPIPALGRLERLRSWNSLASPPELMSGRFRERHSLKTQGGR